MSYEAALQRVGELRTLVDPDANLASSTSTATTPGVFDAQLASAQANQQAALGLSTPASLTPGSAPTAGAGAPDALSQYGLPVLTVADQYRMLGLPVPQAGSMTGLGGVQGMPATVGTGTTGARMVALAQQELGVSETGGRNESPRIREYRAATAGAEGTPGPWCAYFVSWLAQQSGAPVGAGGNGTGYVPTLEAWGKQENRYFAQGAQAPQPGDIVIFDWAGDGVADHTGIVESVEANGTVHTIEGNSSNAVKRRDYPASTNDIKGFVRPG